MSNTYMFGEKNLNPDHYVSGRAGNDDQSMYNGHDQDNLRTTYVDEDGRSPYLPIQDTPGLEATYSFGSAHSSVWLSVFCDGSVHPSTYSLDPFVHRWRGNRADDQVTNAQP